MELQPEKKSREPTFKPVKEWIEEQVIAIDEVSDEDVVVKIDIDKCTTEVPKTFECMICQRVSWNPKECKQCNAIAC